MHPAELAGQGATGRTVPVRVHGFRRSFSQEPSWRAAEGAERGVLTVRVSDSHWFNAILVSGCDALTLRALDHRERGYTRLNVPPSSVDPYAIQDAPDLSGEIALYAGRDEKWNHALVPNPDYLQLCIDAAGQWGSEFLADFLSTTHVGGVTLREFLET